MRSDGTISFLVVQHFGSQHESIPKSWSDSALEHFLFGEMSWADKVGEKGDHYRRLLEPQNASTPLWQKYGVNGYVDRAAADAVLEALRHEHPNREFRLVRRAISQISKVVG
jgi:hypothetical protein